MSSRKPVSRPRTHAPRQQRSRDSMARVMEVTRGLLSRRSFDDVPITEILGRAGHSAGRFYARFSGKEALFEELCRELSADEESAVRVEIAEWRATDVPDLGRRLVGLIARLATRDRELHRSVLLRIWRDPRRHQGLAQRFQTQGFAREVLSALAGSGRLSRKRAQRLTWLVAIVADACRHEFLFGALAGVQPVDEEAGPFLETLALMATTVLSERGSKRPGSLVPTRVRR